MAAKPLEERIQGLPNWAQAHMGTMSRQILALKERMGNYVEDPTPVYSIDVVDGETVFNYLPIPDGRVLIETDKGVYEIFVGDAGLRITPIVGSMAVFPINNGIDLALAPES